MTRQEFVNNVNFFGELLSACIDTGCQICENIYDEYDIDNAIDDWLEGYVVHNTWTDVRERLSMIPEGYDYYLYCGDGEVTGLDMDDFDYYKDEVLQWVDRHDLWQTEDDIFDIEEDYEDNDDDGNSQESQESDIEIPLEPEDFSISELFKVCNGQLQERTL